MPDSAARATASGSGRTWEAGAVVLMLALSAVAMAVAGSL